MRNVRSFRMVTYVLVASCVAQDIAIRAGNLVDPATGKVSSSQTILVRAGKIVSVGPSAAIPQGTKTIDLSKSWVMPGLMDAHTHITMQIPPSPAGESLWESHYVTESSSLRALLGERNGHLLLERGITALRDVGNSADYADTALRQAQDKGWFDGPTIINSGKIIAPFGGQFHNVAHEQGKFWSFEYIDADTPEEVRKAVRENIYYGATVIKLVADNSAFHYSLEEIKAAVDEAHKAGLKVAVHVYGGDAAQNVIDGGADSIEHGWDLTDNMLRSMKEKGIYLVGTDFPYEHLVALGAVGPEDPKILSKKIIDRLGRAYKIGTKLAFGSDVVSELPNENRADMTFDYLKVWRAAGIPPAEILKAMTTNCAELLGIQKTRGAIAQGQAADIIATSGNPLDNIETLRNVNFVMKDGKVIRQ